MARIRLWADIRDTFIRGNNAVAQIITINVAVFAVDLLFRILFRFSESSSRIYDTVTNYVNLPGAFSKFIYQPYSIITYAFMHAGFIHIVFNMLGLYWFGQIVREYIGNRRVWPIFLMGSIAGGLLYLLCYNTIPALQGVSGTTYLLGASAGVLALVVAAATLVPDNQIFLMIIGPVPLKFVAFFYVLLAMAGLAYGSNFGGDVAHLGGAAFGFLFVKQLQKGNDWSNILNRLFDGVVHIFKPRNPSQGKMKVHSVNTANRKAPIQPSVDTQKRLDEILDKISASGYDALSSDEKEFLFNYSKQNQR